MTLVYGKDLLKNAVENNYAIPAFGFVNLEGAIAAIEAAEEANSPIILQTTQGGINFGGHSALASIALSLIKKSKVPIALHMDHGREIEYIINSIDLGYTSLMIDGSTLSLEDNINITNQVIGLYKNSGITIEAELGTIGGKEDDIEEVANFTDVDEAIEFIEKTKGGVDMFAIACGTSHGFYKQEPNLNMKLIEEIYTKTKTPIVLHGGTGVPLNQITESIEYGVAKANFDSELKEAIILGVMEYMEQNPKAYDLRKINRSGINRAKEVALKKIYAVKSNDKNWLN